ncbi:hypothetical protein C1886_03400 [Pseudomonas sp. FW300-N1A1]|uniref:hypothetical protein n=1 Tax=Pseudomonas sp. FW300-N1A1 TaxID=2075555 RepID=UPI000CD04C99|nr:hypothetical protein [Pseudomonas sp. FW300-N1A1]POA21901.1 hypothetical protein C1886_03400 [Pseudomonas sp. FW300-N1A1]
MNRFVLGITALTSGLMGSLALAGAEVDTGAEVAGYPVTLAQNLPGSPQNNPYNSPIRRVNPNSMQGTQPAAPAIRVPNTVPVLRPPTLDNGGIGNGYPRPGATPPTVKPYVSPAPPRRDPDISNR